MRAPDGRKIRIVRRPAAAPEIVPRPAAAPGLDMARRVVSNAARRQAAAHAMAIMGATAATGHKRRPRGMSGSGLSFARHQGLEGRPFATNFMRNEPFALRKAVRVGPHSFSRTNLRQMLTVNPRAVNPLTREPLSARVMNTVLGRRSRSPADLQKMIFEHIHTLVKEAMLHTIDGTATREVSEGWNDMHVEFKIHMDKSYFAVLNIKLKDLRGEQIGFVEMFLEPQSRRVQITSADRSGGPTVFKNAVKQAVAQYKQDPVRNGWWWAEHRPGWP